MQPLTQRAIRLAREIMDTRSVFIPTMVFRNRHGEYGLFGFDRMPPIPEIRRGLVQMAAYDVFAVDIAFMAETWLVDRDIIPIEIMAGLQTAYNEDLSKHPNARDVITVTYHSMLTDFSETYIASVAGQNLGPFEKAPRAIGELTNLFDKTYG